MTKKEIMHTQERVGTEVDGWWGPKSTAAAKKHLRDMMPNPHPFPTQKQVQNDVSIYGPHGEKDGSYSPPTKTIRLPFKLHLYGDSAKKVGTLRPHELVADSLLNVFERLAIVYDSTEARKKAGILDYYGLYNPRPIRGGNIWSMHAYAVAIDFDAPRNKLKWHWPRQAHMPIEAMECFAQEGWRSAGAFWSADAMHMDAVRP